MDQNINLAIDSKTLEACIKTYDRWGTTVYHNICTGAHTALPWGVGGWVAVVAVGVMVALVLTIIGIAIKAVFD